MITEQYLHELHAWDWVNRHFGDGFDSGSIRYSWLDSETIRITDYTGDFLDVTVAEIEREYPINYDAVLTFESLIH